MVLLEHTGSQDGYANWPRKAGRREGGTPGKEPIHRSDGGINRCEAVAVVPLDHARVSVPSLISYPLRCHFRLIEQ